MSWTIDKDTKIIAPFHTSIIEGDFGQAAFDGAERLIKAISSKPVTSVEKQRTPNVSFDPFFLVRLISIQL